MMFTSSNRPATEWGPAKHDPDHPLRPVAGVDLRDDDAARPDDN